MSLAHSAQFLGPQQSPLYRPTLPPDFQEHIFQLAQSFTSPPESLDTVEDLALYASISHYLVFAGRLDQSQPLAIAALNGAQRMGLLDESHPSWANIDGEERDRRRHVASTVIEPCR